MAPMNFREAMDALGVSAAEVARAFGLTPQTIRQMRLDPGRPGYRSPPERWQQGLAELARERGGQLEEIAVTLEGEAASQRREVRDGARSSPPEERSG